AGRDRRLWALRPPKPREGRPSGLRLGTGTPPAAAHCFWARSRRLPSGFFAASFAGCEFGCEFGCDFGWTWTTGPSPAGSASVVVLGKPRAFWRVLTAAAWSMVTSERTVPPAPARPVRPERWT